MDAQNNTKVMLVVLDGWGIGKKYIGNAVFLANTPTIDNIENKYFKKVLQASGIAVGLLWGREGNSEVGHLNLGAGKIIYQYMPRIIEAIRDGSFFKNPAFLKAVEFTKNNQTTLHIMGLISSGTVHSYIDHFYALLELVDREKLNKVILHLFTDGKDGAPNEGKNIFTELTERLKKYPFIKIGSVMGRMYAMDRNNNWNYTKNAYDLLAAGLGQKITDVPTYLNQAYQEGLNDFTIKPAAVYKDGEPVGLVKENDAIIFFNFREDSTRQITRVFLENSNYMNNLRGKNPEKILFVGMTNYQEDLPIEVAFMPNIIKYPLAKILSDSRKKQLHIAESEKYAHVTYFFNGQNEKAYPNEDRIIVASTESNYYTKTPEMQTNKITDIVLKNIDNYDFFLINFANADMLAHTGNIEITKKGVEAIDNNIAKLQKACQEKNIILIITSDHGHAEEMMDQRTAEAITKHSINPIPFYIVSPNFKKQDLDSTSEGAPDGILADVAPTILKLMGLPIPEDMDGTPLF